MKSAEGTRNFIGRTTHVLVQWEGKSGAMEFWQSYPSFRPKGVKKFTADYPLSESEVKRQIKKWEKGGGIAF